MTSAKYAAERSAAEVSHWGYQSEYCNPAKGNEKGGVEGELGWYRRNCLVPVPEARDLATLNAQLLAACVASRDSKWAKLEERTQGQDRRD